MDKSYIFPNPDPKYRKQILQQSIRDLLEDLFYVSGQIDNFLCQSDYADYKREDEWFKLYYDIKEEIIRRTGEEDDD